MSKYINADRLCEDLMTRWEIADKEKEKEIQSIMADIVTPIVVEQPAADVEEVVHCKDCKYWDYKCQGDFNFIYGDCLYWEIENYSDYPMETTGEHYCGFAERRENECGKR